MPDYALTLSFLDVQNGKTTRTLRGTFADFAAASSAASTALSAWQAIAGAKIYRQSLQEVTEIAGAAPSNESVFMQANLSVELSGGVNKLGNLFVPSPVAAAFVGTTNVVDTTAAVVTNLITLYATAGGTGWTISDGETIDSLRQGERSYVNSGKTNLPA